MAVTETVVTEEAYEENAVPAVNELINSYFTAYASGDLVTLQTLATPITQNEQSYITLISQYIEQYQDINCYTKSGLDSNLYGKCQPECEVYGSGNTCTGTLFLLCQNK